MGMKNLTHETQIRYSNMVLQKLRKNTLLRALFNGRYEGSPVAGAVKIPVRDTEVAVGTEYDIKNGVDMGTSATTYMTLPIDKDMYVNELIDGYEAAAVPDNLAADRLDSAGYSLAVKTDLALSNLLVTKATVSANTKALTPSNIYESIVDDITVLKKMGIKPDEMWLLCTNETYAILLKCPEFIRSTALGDATVLNGEVGKIAGVRVIESNNVNVEGLDYILGNSIFAHFVDDWKTPVAIKDLNDGKHIGASALQGRRVYGLMLSRPATFLQKKTVAESKDSETPETPATPGTEQTEQIDSQE